jgi:hypothetical protein
MAINTTTMDDSVRYIKQMKSRYNEIQYHKDNVVAIKFSTRPDGLKGFEFLNYEPEDELIKPVDKASRVDEDKEIINRVKLFDMSIAQIAEELKPKFAPDIELGTYYQRIKKRVQRMKAKGLIEDQESAPPPLIIPVKPAPEVLTPKINVAKAPEANMVNVASVNKLQPETKPRFNPELQAILDEQQKRVDAEDLQAFTELMTDMKNRNNTTAI